MTSFKYCSSFFNIVNKKNKQFFIPIKNRRDFQGGSESDIYCYFNISQLNVIINGKVFKYFEIIFISIERSAKYILFYRIYYQNVKFVQIRTEIYPIDATKYKKFAVNH